MLVQEIRYEISMDFITELPESEGCKYLWVIVDCLSKTFVFEAMPTMKAEACAQRFMECWVRHHSFLRAITATGALTGLAHSGNSFARKWAYPRG
jgi:hypothetical protein